MVVNYLGLGHYERDAYDTFTDIGGHWAADAICTAFAQGWVNGFADGSFKPNQSITRAEVAAMVNRATGRLPQTAADLPPGMVTWTDNMDKSAWYYVYIQAASNSATYKKKADGIYQKWVKLVPSPHWSALEQPDATPFSHTGGLALFNFQE